MGTRGGRPARRADRRVSGGAEGPSRNASPAQRFGRGTSASRRPPATFRVRNVSGRARTGAIFRVRNDSGRARTGAIFRVRNDSERARTRRCHARRVSKRYARGRFLVRQSAAALAPRIVRRRTIPGRASDACSGSLPRQRWPATGATRARNRCLGNDGRRPARRVLGIVASATRRADRPVAGGSTRGGRRGGRYGGNDHVRGDASPTAPPEPPRRSFARQRSSGPVNSRCCRSLMG